MAVSAQATHARNWRRMTFFTIEIIYAIIAGTSEAYMYAAYSAEGPERWPEAIARATITQFAIIFFGVAGIEAMRWPGKFIRVFGVLGSWAATIIASVITFWFLFEAAQVFRDTAMLAPLKDATIPLPNGGAIPTWLIDIALIAALPFFQCGLNILAPIITADHAPESQEEMAARHAREEAQAAHKAKMAQFKGAGIGSMIGGGIKAVKQQVTGDDTAGYDESKPTGTDDASHGVTGGDTAGYDTASGQSGYGTKAPVSIKRGQWTSRDLKDYAQQEYRAEVSDIEAARAMSVLSQGAKKGNAYVAPRAKVKAWVDGKYGEAQATGTSPR